LYLFTFLHPYTFQNQCLFALSDNLLGNLTSQTDARGCVLTLTYDILSRLDTRSSSGACGTQVSTIYTYDATTNGKGLRTGMNDASGITLWTYDTRGRLDSESRNITGAGIFDTSWTYNSADLPITMTYPDDEEVAYDYNNRMLLNSVTGTSTYVASTIYDSVGRMDLRTFGTSPALQTDYVYYPWTAQGGRLQYLKSGTSGSPTSLQSLEYAYDASGNVDWIKDWKAASPQLQDFGYDVLDRLTRAVATGGSGLYNETYTYDPASGNLASKAGTTLTYNEQVTCPAGTRTIPHAVSAMGSNSYDYDCNGNQATRVVNGQTFNLSYDAKTVWFPFRRDSQFRL
jgi:YD repeat-containing protein